ncbi:MAG: IclR family transcriptional regulator [Cypionkella sp.]|uniref:IclR family transcriptional regulator n=1 Tax=Cypionkella sp. TaxID=2811411 RepID=UPI0026264D3F|nr:IclR family transcriptional regulator [Cypionkella sp.]MDB5661323.1 IclR family transcriptional regulator [Cypionkella sp.]
MSNPPRLRGRPKSTTDKTEQNTVQALDRALGLLKLLADSAGLTLSELTEQSALPVATVFRALVTLQRHGMVELEDPGQVWHIGPGTFRAASAFLKRTKVTERARAPMESLMVATGETVSLGIEAAGEVLFLAQVETTADLRAFFPPGTTGLMHLCAPGKALLAWYPERKTAEILKRKGLARATTLSLSSIESLERDLSRSRSRGFAIDDQERAEGMRGVAAPIFNAFSEPVAAIGIAGPSFRMGLSDATRFGSLVRAAADQITEAIGGAVPQ